MKLSLDEWFDLPEDEPGEVVDGRLEEEEEPGYLHELLVARLGRILGDWIFPQGGLVAGSNALEILQLDPQGRYVHVLGASTGMLETIPGCEGLTLDLDALWAAVDSLE
ncbi:MAG: hypothetical protein DMF53_16655 [Acidobacteria bacterium]|nr:MAG: hypothetical protein DMF53_16655 [Acidobacteriota bacterium]